MEDAVVAIQRAARRMIAKKHLCSKAPEANAEKSGIASGAEEAEKPCPCCRPPLREGFAFDHNITLQDWRPGRKDEGTELTTSVLSVGDEKSGGSKGYSGRKFPVWMQAVDYFVQVNLVPSLMKKFGSDLSLLASSPPMEPYEDSVASVIDGMIHTIECSHEEELRKRIRKFTHQQFVMEFLLGTCITRRGGHFLSIDINGLRYLLDQALANAKSKTVDPKNQRPYVYLEEKYLIETGDRPTMDQYRSGILRLSTFDVRVRCMKDHQTKPCEKYITLAGMADNLRRIAGLLRGVVFPEPLAPMNPFEDAARELIKFAEMVEKSLLEIANALDSRAVAQCPGRGCSYIQRPMVPARIGGSLRWVRTKIHDCQQCGLSFCCDCGAEVGGENHVCDMMHHFNSLPEATKSEIRNGLGTRFQFCPECKTVAEHGKAGEDTGCDKLTCTECRTCFCVRCGERVDPATYFGEHMIHLHGCGRILCRFSTVYEGAGIQPDGYKSMFGFHNQSAIRNEVLGMIANGNRRVLQDFKRIAREREMYPNAIHPRVKAALERIPELHLHITPEEQNVLFRE